VKITSKGQVTIPVEVREGLGLLPETEVDFIVDGDGARIVRRSIPNPEGRGAKIIRKLRGTGSIRMTTDEILALTRRP
jgi:AbrB family looped-hinge helix DNA binding protein